tara:strand:+ start:1471 stop:2925 length:1455 start_codon:yes stop_codon:yes gene_type:complete
MATVNTNDLKIKNAKNLIASFNTGTTANSYVFVGRVQPWADENVPTPPQNNYREFYDTYDNMFALSRINDTDAFHMIPKLKWVSGAVYDRYQHNYTSVNKSFSGASNLYDSNFVVLNRLNSVYVCLDNDGNTTSTVEPQSTGDDPFYTSDGYQWLRVYDITSNNLGTKSTNNLMPITTNKVVSTTDGELYTVIIDSPGSGFTINPIGSSNQVSSYYANIDGDGVNAVAKVTITNTVVSKIEVVRNGSGYTFATLDFVSGEVYESLNDLDLEINGLNPEGNGDLRTTVIISPPGGWGTDLTRELGGTKVGVFSSLNYTLFKNHFPSSFRQIGILQDFAYSGAGTNPAYLQACYAVKVSAPPTGSPYNLGEEITQVVKSDGVDKLAKGLVVGWDSVGNVLRYTQSSVNTDSDGQLYRFNGQNNIIGNVSCTPETTYSGTVGDTTFTDGYAQPELTKYSGLMTYLTNISPVVRDPNQTERISLVIAF